MEFSRNYAGAQIFEALGIVEEVIKTTKTTSRVGGMTFEDIASEVDDAKFLNLCDGIPCQLGRFGKIGKVYPLKMSNQHRRL